LSAGSDDFPVASRGGNTGLESPVNPQAGKPALRPSAVPTLALVGKICVAFRRGGDKPSSIMRRIIPFFCFYFYRPPSSLTAG
jgi:hypothetical protein